VQGGRGERSGQSPGMRRWEVAWSVWACAWHGRGPLAQRSEGARAPAGRSQARALMASHGT
jgi:hypothetical protein